MSTYERKTIEELIDGTIDYLQTEGNALEF